MARPAVALLNKNNSTSDAVQVEVNLQEQFSDRLHFRKQMLLKYPTFKHLLANMISATSRRGYASRGKCAGDIRCRCFYSKCITSKCFTLKMRLKVTKSNNHNGPVRWQMSTSITVLLEHFSLALHFWRYSHLKTLGLENVGQGHDAQHSQWCHSIANS